MKYTNLIQFLLICVMGLLAGSVSHAAGGPAKTAEIKPALIFHNYCSVCHGDRGDGRSRARGSLVPPPTDFTAAAELGRDTMINVVLYGKPGTAMVGWHTQLSEKEVEAVVDYVRESFMVVALDPRLKRGKALYARDCAVCHGERGQGSASPVGGLVPPRDLSSPQAREELTRERMLSSVAAGRKGTVMEAFSPRMSTQDIEAVVDYVRAALMVPAMESVSGTRAYGGRTRDVSKEQAKKPAAAVRASNKAVKK